jgi:NAD dependent epimerase/dehydratase family enzyme
VIHRPAVLPTPGFALKMLLGEMAEGLLLSGQRAIPAKPEQLGFQFRYRDLEPALRAIFSQ